MALARRIDACIRLGLYFLSNHLGASNLLGVHISGFIIIIIRPSVAGAVLQTTLSLINYLSHPLLKYLQNTVPPKP